MSQNSYQLITLTSNIVLSWPSSFGAGPMVLDINDVNPNAGGRTITMPNATLVPNGTSTIFNNISAYSFTILASDGVTTIATVATGVVYSLYLYNNSTSNGLWRTIAAGGGATSITTFTAESTDDSITITNGVVTAPSGTIDFQLPTSLTNLNTGVSSVGFPVLTKTGPNKWGSVTFTGGTNINITNSTGASNGSAANPIFNLDTTITGLDSITVGNVTISGDTILNTNTGQNLDITTDGTANISLNGMLIDSNGNLTVSGTFKNPFTPKAWVTFTDTLIGTNYHSIIYTNYANINNTNGIISTGNGQYTITFATPLSLSNYGVIITAGSTGSSLPTVVHGLPIITTQTTTSFSIVVVDASGEPVTQIPNGITVLVLSSS